MRRRFVCCTLREESGQALIEFALVFPLVLFILFGAIDLGWIFNNVSGVRQGVNDGARQAAVGLFGTNSTCALTGASGATTGTKQLMCLVHSLDGINSDTTTRVAIAVGDNTNPQPPGVYAQGSPVTVCEQYKMGSLTSFTSFVNWGVSTSTATDRVEVANTSTPLATAAETPLNSGWPTVCTKGPAPVS